MQSTDQNQPTILRRALSGLVLLGVGLGLLLVAWDYPLGRVSQMGPGFIPLVVGFAICALALAIILADVTSAKAERPAGMHWRGLIFVSAAITLFAVLIEIAGLVPSMFVAVAVSMLADDKARVLNVLVYSCIAALFGWLLFTMALELPIPAFRRWP